MEVVCNVVVMVGVVLLVFEVLWDVLVLNGIVNGDSVL